jgi:hypothetical protein
MTKEHVRASVNARIKTHYQQDQELADRIGLGKVDPNSGLNKIPLRVKSETVSPNERRETIIKN